MKLSKILEALNELFDDKGEMECYALGLTENSELGVMPMGIGVAELDDGSGIVFGSTQDFLDYFSDDVENTTLN
jgi:hypothetical protein